MKENKPRFKVTDELCQNLRISVSFTEDAKGSRIEIALYPNFQGIVFLSTDHISDKRKRWCQAALENRNLIFLKLYEFELHILKNSYYRAYISELILMMEPLNNPAQKLFKAAQAHEEFCEMLWLNEQK